MDNIIERKRNVLKLRIVNMLFGMTQAATSFRVLLLQEVGLTATSVGIVICITSILAAITPAIGGMISDKLRSKYRVFVFISAACLIVSLFTLIARSIDFAGPLLMVILIPLLQAFMQPGYSTIESASVTATLRYPGLEYGTLRLCMSAACSALCFAYSPLVSIFGIGTPFLGNMIFFGALILMSGTLKKFENFEKDDENSAKTSVTPQEKLHVSRIFKKYYLVVFLVVSTVLGVMMGGNAFVVYLIEEIGGDTSTVGTVMGVRVCAEVAALAIMSRVKKHFSLSFIQVIAAVFFCAEAALYPECKSIEAIAIVNMFGGAAWGATLASSLIYARRMAPIGLEDTTISLWNAGLSVGGFVTTIMFGRMIDVYGIFSIYKVTLSCGVAWLIIFIGAYFLGKYALHKNPPDVMFRSSKKHTDEDSV